MIVAHLERQARCVLPRLGAGKRLNEALVVGRWAKELAEDADVSIDEATKFTAFLQRDILQAIEGLTDPRRRVSAARVVYAHAAEVAASDPGNQTASGKHMVYLLSDEKGVLLYVGITDRGPVRLAEHYRHKPWFPRVSQVQFERYESRALSEERERHLIQSRAPLFNIQHNQGRQLA